MNTPHFRPLFRFKDDTGNVYDPEFTYNASSPRLIRMVEKWLEEGKVEWVIPGLKGQVGGRGSVK